MGNHTVSIWFILFIIINATKLDGFGNYMWYTTKIKSMKHVPMQSICGMSSTRGSSMDRMFAISLLLSLRLGISRCFCKLIEYKTMHDASIAQYLYLLNIYFIQTRESGTMGDKYLSYTKSENLCDKKGSDFVLPNCIFIHNVHCGEYDICLMLYVRNFFWICTKFLACRRVLIISCMK
eukprot:603858_1